MRKLLYQKIKIKRELRWNQIQLRKKYQKIESIVSTEQKLRAVETVPSRFAEKGRMTDKSIIINTFKTNKFCNCYIYSNLLILYW